MFSSVGQHVCRQLAACSKRDAQPANNSLDAELLETLIDSNSALLARLRRTRRQAKASTEASFHTEHDYQHDGPLDPNSSPQAATELYWCDNVLTWTRGYKLVRCFEFEEPIIKAFWSWMEIEGPDCIEEAPGKFYAGHVAEDSSDPAGPSILKGCGSFSAAQRNPLSSASGGDKRKLRSGTACLFERALCIFFEQGLLMHLPERGEQYQIELPFRLAKAFPMPVGLMIQRQTELEDVEIADRVERQRRSQRGDPESSSFDGYPFSVMQNTSQQPKTPDSVPLALSDHVEEELASNILPMAFYLRRPFDELAQVDLFPQISEWRSDTQLTGGHLVHGPATPFTEVDEKIVFVSPGSGRSRFSILVTASHRTGSVRIYSFAATPTRPPSTSIILSSRLPGRNSSGLASSSLGMQPIDSSTGQVQSLPDSTMAGLLDASQLAMPSSGSGPSTSHSRKSSGNGLHHLGRGMPPPRKSIRTELERRTSNLGTTRGRDPSGRSRRISAMHGGNTERRLASRVDETLSHARDRLATGNMSQTVDGLRRQSRAYAQETMLDEMGAGNASIRMAGQLPTSSRLRRTSQAVRTPYAAPRTSTRQPGTAARMRPSVSLPRPDASLDADFDLTTFAGPIAGRLGAYDHEGMEPNDPSVLPEDVEAFGSLTDLDNFARSFAAVSLLDEIKVEELKSPEDADRIQAFFARFAEARHSSDLLYIAVPCADKTYCRQVGKWVYAAEATAVRDSLYCRHPDHLTATAIATTPAMTVTSTMCDAFDELLFAEANGMLRLSVGTHFLDSTTVSLGPWTKWATELAREYGQKSRIMALERIDGTQVSVLEDNPRRKTHISLDFGPRCRLTKRALRVLASVLQPKVFNELRAAWIRHRFGLGLPTQQQETQPVLDQDWRILASLLTGKPPTSSYAHTSSSGEVGHDPASSITHHQHVSNELLAGLAPMPTSARPAPAVVQSPPILTGNEETKKAIAALHLLAQDARLDATLSLSDVPKLARLIMSLASRSGHLGCMDYWARIQPDISMSVQVDRTALPTSVSLDPPFDVYEILASPMKDKRTMAFGDLLRTLITGHPGDEGQAANLNRICHRISRMLELYSILSSLHGTADQRPSTSSVAHQVVSKMIEVEIGTEELKRLPFGLALPLLEAIRTCQLDPPMGWSASAYALISRADLALHASIGAAGHSLDLTHTVSSKLLKTLPRSVAMDQLCAQLFSKDFRLVDVVRMLQTTQANTVHVPEGESLTDAAVAEQHNCAVATITERTKALPVGRGMLLMASRPFRVTQKWQIPQLNLAVKVLPRGTTIEPDSKAESAALEWPEFHNGVASILEISVQKGSKIDSKWIFSHLGDEVTAKHAGFLFGLGLTKHLPALTPVHVFRYLRTRHNLLTIGFLLGLAAASVGTGDPAARHLLGMQLVAFLPSGSAPLNLSIITQTAGLLAMGLVFLGSNHRWTAKRMLQQIGAVESPTPDIQPQHREAYSLSAGMALGLVLLGKGTIDGMSSLPDKRILARLEELINGSHGSIGRAGGISSTNKLKLDPDLNLTSTPASIALALLFLRSNRRDVADILALPKSDKALDYVRPDVLMIRVLARYLILWDEIQCSEEWIFNVLPDWMQDLKGRKRKLSEAAQLAYINIRAGACFAIGLKHAGSHDAQARTCLTQQLVQLHQDVKINPISYFSNIRQSATRVAVDLVTVSLAMVMSGSGDVNLLRMLRMAHGDVNSGMTYGSHMATHMAIGLLFLGGGRLTLGSSDSAIAALLIAFFPRFPSHPSDNRAHLQAFRHLWVLAVEPRLLIAKDIETGEVTCLPMCLAVSGDQAENAKYRRRVFTPALLPRFESILSIKTDTARYWPAALHVSKSVSHAKMLLASRILHVQRKTGHLTYIDDPHGSRSIFSRSLGTAPLDLDHSASYDVGPSIEELRVLINGFSNGGKYGELVERVCNAASVETEHAMQARALLRTMVMECLTLDKPGVIPIYLSLALSDDRALNDLLFAEEYYASWYDEKRPPLVQQGLLSKLLLDAKTHSRAMMQMDKVATYFQQAGTVDRPLSALLTTARVPPLHVLEELRSLIHQTVAGRKDGTGLKPLLAMMIRTTSGEWSEELLDTFLDVCLS